MPDFDTQQPPIPLPILRAPEPPVHNILIGPLGLRAGWGIALFLVCMLLVGALGFSALRAHSPQLRQQIHAQHQAQLAAKRPGAHVLSPPVPQLFVLAQDGDGTAAVLLAALALSLLERRRVGVYGLQSRYLRDLLPGALVGFLSMAALIFVLWSLRLVSFDRQLLHGAAAVHYGLTWLLLFALVGVFEECLFRGYLQYTLMRGVLGLAHRLAPTRARLVAFWISAVAWSLVFLLSHGANSGETGPGLAAVFLAGMLFAYALWRTGSLWWGIGFHATWDWSQSFLYGVPDSGTLSAAQLFQTHPAGRTLLSGGVDGPEGSLFVLPVLCLVFLVLRRHPPQPQPPVLPWDADRVGLPAHLA